jgi:hypothetical protein
MWAFAEDLIAGETGENQSSETKPPADFPVFEKLRSPLATLMGNGGFRALFARALALARVEISWLRAVHVNADGALAWQEELHPPLAPAEFLEGRVVLLAQLLGLLVAFIGPGLTARLIGEIWPNIMRNELVFPQRRQK